MFVMGKLPPVGETSVTPTVLNPGIAVTVAVKVFPLLLSVKVPAFMVSISVLRIEEGLG